MKVKAQLERLQLSGKQALEYASARVAAWRSLIKKPVDGHASEDAPTPKKRGASLLRGPWRRQPVGAVAAEQRSSADTAQVIPTPVASEPVELIAAAEMVRPFLLVCVLALFVVWSAVAVIFAAYDYRHYFHEHQQLIQQRDDLQVEWGQLLLEQSAWAANNRVEVQAIRQLDMQVPAPEQIEIVRRGN